MSQFNNFGDKFMRKLFSLLFVLFFTFQSAFCAQNLSVIYINGSNNNDEKMKSWFFDGVNNFHPVFKKYIEADEYMRKYFLNNSTQVLSETPNTLFWGDMSKNELSYLKEDLDIMDVLSPKLAQLVRRAFALIIHDAIWVSRTKNMYPIIQLLHSQIMDEYKKGNQSLLMGYSAGTFVTYQYFVFKLPYLDKENIVSTINMDNETREYLSQADFQPTCVDALLNSNLIYFGMKDIVHFNGDKAYMKETVSRLDSYTNTYCAPKDSIKGIVNYACPISLFYSDPSDPNAKFTKMYLALFEYIFKNDIFWLTVNWAEDPMGYPLSKNLTIPELEVLMKVPISPVKGFFYDKSDTRSRKTFISAHTSYWSQAKKFSKAIISAYKEGRALFGLDKDNI